VLQERWLLWKAGLYDLEVVPLRECYFWMGGLVYDSKIGDKHMRRKKRGRNGIS